MQEITINQINQGGMADSKYEGEKNSVAKLVGLDIHSVPGTIQSNFKLKKDSGSVIDEFCKCIVTSSNGSVYFFSSEAGKIWEKSKEGVYTLKYDLGPQYSSTWRVPSDDDWTNFTDYVNDYQSTPPDYDYRYNNEDGAIGKSLANTSGWGATGIAGRVGNDQASNNATGFTGKPGGYRFDSGSFIGLNTTTRFWSSTFSFQYAWRRSLSAYNVDVSRNWGLPSYGNSIRLVRDDTSSDPDGTIYANNYTGNDGKKYDGVKIGDWVWLAENLKETKYADGTDIPEITDDTDWANDTTGAWCKHSNDNDNYDEYGALYNFHAVDNERNMVSQKFDGDPRVLGAAEYKGFLFFATSNYLYKVPIDSEDWGELKSKWQPAHDYTEGDIVFHGDRNYECIQLHLSSDWSSLQVWVFEKDFEEGDFVVLEGVPYECLAAHEADLINKPGQKDPPAWDSGEYYDRGSRVEDTEILYECTSSHPADSDSQPGSGEEWESFWKVIDSWGAFWVELTDNEPHYGKDKAEFWKDTEDKYVVQWEQFLKTDPDYHPMAVARDGLYIGDGYYLAEVKPAPADPYGPVYFTGQALDLMMEHRIKALSAIDIQLAIGTHVNNDVSKTTIYRWDTWTYTWNMEDEIDEVGINAFIPVDNYFYVQAGNVGSIYSYDYNMLYLTKRIPGDWVGRKASRVYPNATAFFKQRPLFGVSKEYGAEASGAIPGVYSYATVNPRLYNRVLAIEHLTSTYSDETIIGAIETQGDQIYVSWKDGSNTGVDIIDYENRYESAYLESRVIFLDRLLSDTYTYLTVGYVDMPEGCAVKAYVKLNYGTEWEEVELIHDSIRGRYYSELRKEANVIEVKIELVSSGALSPKIDYISLTGEDHREQGIPRH